MIRVLFVDEEVKQSYELLKYGKSEDRMVYKMVNQAIGKLLENSCFGIKIPTNLWPKVYIEKYGVRNLWKCDLPNGWRLIYTVKSDNYDNYYLIIEWFDHKEYERRFNY